MTRNMPSSSASDWRCAVFSVPFLLNVADEGDSAWPDMCTFDEGSRRLLNPREET